jgi:haloacid dehalogenase superfamily, subfamily IA, variant 3 with third motif having DD or ED
MIRNLFFDMGGVLVSLDRGKCISAFKAIGIDNFGEFLSAYAQKGFFAKFENGDITESEFYDSVRNISNNKCLTDKQIEVALLAFLTVIEIDKVELLIELKKNYKLYLLSNINPIAWRRCKELFKEAKGVDIDSVFEICFLSYELNASKPYNEIFEKAIKLSGVKPEETLFIDDAKANILTGEEIGFKTLLYDVTTNLPEKVMEALK